MKKNTIIYGAATILLLTAYILFLVYLQRIAYRAKYNVVLITIGTLRADHLSCYGYHRNTSPHIDELAKKGILFEQAISHANWTLPSHASILTSKYVWNHWVDSRDKSLAHEEITLAEIMKKYWCKTAAFVGGLDLVSNHGLNQGFDLYYDETGDEPMGSFKDIIPKAIQWLRKNKNKRFFLYIHGYDPHPPYSTPDPYRSLFTSDYDGKLSVYLSITTY